MVKGQVTVTTAMNIRFSQKAAHFFKEIIQKLNHACKCVQKYYFLPYLELRPSCATS